jgi:hypothetical protein
MQRQNETEIYHLPFDFEEATRAAKASNILCLAQTILEKVDLVPESVTCFNWLAGK